MNTNKDIPDIILSSFTGGPAYVNSHVPPAAQLEAPRADEPTSLFVQDDEGSEYDPEGEEINIDSDVDTLVTWLNSLAPQVVSIVSLLTPLFVFTNVFQGTLMRH